MFNIFKKPKKIIYFLRNIENDKKEGNKPFTIIVNGNDSVDIQITSRHLVNHFGLEYDDKFGFVILVFFNRNKDSNELYYSRFKANKYFDLFTMFVKDGSDNYILDCKNDINKTETVAIDILKNVFDHKKIKTKKITIY